MTPFDFTVLFWTPRRDVPMSDARGLHRQREFQRKRSTVVALQLSDGKRHGLTELPEERQADPVIQMPIEA